MPARSVAGVADELEAVAAVQASVACAVKLCAPGVSVAVSKDRPTSPVVTAKRGRAVEDFHRCAGFGGAGEMDRIVAGESVAGVAGIVAVAGDGHGRCDGVDDHRQRRGGDVAGGVGCPRRQVVPALAEDRRVELPIAVGVDADGQSNDGRAVENIDRGIRRGRPGEMKLGIRRDAVSCSGVIAEGDNDRRLRGRRVDLNRQGSRKGALVAGNIGGGRPKGVAAIAERERRSRSSGPPRWRCRCRRRSRHRGS